MSLHKYRGLALVALWQVAPVVVHQDSAGRVQIHFAGGGGRYEEVITNCDGEVVDTRDIGYTGGGGAVEVWPTDWARVNAFAGGISAEDPDFSDMNLGALAALEWRHVGVGVGGNVAPGEGELVHTTPEGEHYVSFDPTELYPIIYARAGNIDRGHLRIESSSAEGLDRMGGLVRIGYGWNQGLLRGPAMYTGLAFCHAGCDGSEGETVVFFLDLNRPIARHFDLKLGVLAGAGQNSPEYGFTLGGSWLPRATLAPAQDIVPAPAPDADAVPAEETAPESTEVAP